MLFRSMIDIIIYIVFFISHLLTHSQIRCIMSMLFLVGSKQEDISIISQLLDITSYPNKPQYLMADPEPLVLYDCIFNPGESARDSRSARYYQIIKSHPLYQGIVESNTKDGKAKYNCNPCCFDDSLSEMAFRELIGYGESQLHDAEIVHARYSQMLTAVKEEYADKYECTIYFEYNF